MIKLNIKKHKRAITIIVGVVVAGLAAGLVYQTVQVNRLNEEVSTLNNRVYVSSQRAKQAMKDATYDYCYTAMVLYFTYEKKVVYMAPTTKQKLTSACETVASNVANSYGDNAYEWDNSIPYDDRFGDASKGLSQ